MSNTQSGAGTGLSMALPTATPMEAEAENDPIPEAFDASRNYEVRFAEVVKISPWSYSPSQGPILMKGGPLNRILKEVGAHVIRSAVAR